MQLKQFTDRTVSVPVPALPAAGDATVHSLQATEKTDTEYK